MTELDSWLTKQIACPKTGSALRQEGDCLISETGNRYPIVEGVPVLLNDQAPHTIQLAQSSLERARGTLVDARAPHLYLESLGVSEKEKQELIDSMALNEPGIDPFVNALIAATNGMAYKNLVGKLDRYPIPEPPIERNDGKLLLDIGCSWGRWSIAAARKGYKVVGIDPSLSAVMAAQRVNKSLGLNNLYIVGDARHLPFSENIFDLVFSYSVLQHFSQRDAVLTLRQIARVLKPGARSMVQMANARGLRSLYHQVKRGSTQPTEFDVRYWRLSDLQSMFQVVGDCKFHADCYLGLGLQKSDSGLLPPILRFCVAISEALKRMSRRSPNLINFADSIYVECVRTSDSIGSS